MLISLEWLRLGSHGQPVIFQARRPGRGNASTVASYLEIALVLIDHGAQTVVDLRDLWSRIVFNMLVSNTDDQARGTA